MDQKKPKILIFSLSYYPHFVGGAEVAIKEITDRLGEFDFDMVTLRFERSLPKVEKIGNVTVHRIGWTSSNKVTPTHVLFWLNLNKYFFPITGFFKAMMLSRRYHYAAMWGMMATYSSFAALFLKLLSPKTKFLLTLQEGDPIPHIKKRALPVWPLFKLMFKKADCLQTISKYLADFGREMGAIGPIIVVPNGVDVKRFSKGHTLDEIKDIQVQIGKKEGDVFLIHTGRLVLKNALDDVISALPLLPSNIKFLLVGRGPLEENLKTQARILGVGERVIFHDFVDHEKLALFLKASDIFIRTPISEGFGNSFVEAMAAGIPCVATPVGGILDFIRDGETGVFAQVHNPQSVADAVTRLSRDTDLYSRIKRQAFEMVKEKYDWDIIGDEMRKIFKSL